jgi:Tfp pilus assembly protein PilZ
MTSDRRRHTRYDILAQLRIKKDDTVYIMPVENVSRSGVFVSSDIPEELPLFALNQELEMNLFTIEGLENIRVVGRIVRITQDEETMENRGFGIEFSFMTEAARKQLYSLVALAREESIHPPPLPDTK